MVKAQRPSARSRALSRVRSARHGYLAVMIWSGLTGNCERLSETGSRNIAQNLPRPGTDRFGIRSAFIPKAGHVFVVVDYEQLEMRLLAHFSQDPNMIDVINRGWDIHTGTAALMFGHKYDDIVAALNRKKLAAKDPNVTLTPVEKEMCFSRQSSKSIGFGLNYGEGPKKLAKTLGVSVNEAKALMAKYFEPYPLVQEFIESVHAFMLDHGVVETILGRPRRFHEMADIRKLLKNTRRKYLPGTAKKNLARAERQSLNSCVQGSAADVAKMAMIKCEFDRRLQQLDAQMLLQIHDELIFEVPEENAKEAMRVVCEIMEHPFDEDLLVPLDVDGGIGAAWSEAKA